MSELILFFISYLRWTWLFLFCEISILSLVSKTHWEKDGFFSVNEWNLEEKNAIFLNKILWKIAGKAVLDDLNYKIFFVSQPWWLTGFQAYTNWPPGIWNDCQKVELSDHNDPQDWKCYFQCWKITLARVSYYENKWYHLPF